MERANSVIQLELNELFPEGAEPASVECVRALINTILQPSLPEGYDWTYDHSGSIVFIDRAQQVIHQTDYQISPFFHF